MTEAEARRAWKAVRCILEARWTCLVGIDLGQQPGHWVKRQAEMHRDGQADRPTDFQTVACRRDNGREARGELRQEREIEKSSNGRVMDR